MTDLVSLTLNDFFYNRIISRSSRFGSLSLHVVTCPQSNEIIQLFLTDYALVTLTRQSFEQIRYLLWKNSNRFRTNEYIEWSLIGTNLIEKRREFREQIDLYKTYDNQKNFITRILLEIIDYYLNEYICKHEDLTDIQRKKIEDFFRNAIHEQNYFKYFIKAYTFTNDFHHILNKHLALYILDYFELENQRTISNYRLINCLIHIITLIINHPDIDRYDYRGITYRGSTMNEHDLEAYQIGNHILNRSFVSTSKQREIAKLFTSNNTRSDDKKIPVLLRYRTKQKRTAIDIENMSIVKDEEEVLILPFSVFKVTQRSSNNDQSMIEINLEECEDNQTRKIQYSLAIGFGLLIILASILALLFGNYAGNNSDKQIQIKPTCPSISIIDRSLWNASKPFDTTLLPIPVPYVAIHQTLGMECFDFLSCAHKIQDFQTSHMLNYTWNDIAYNFLVDSHGDIYEGRGWKYEGAHCRTYNSRSIGIVISSFSFNKNKI